MRKLLLFVAIFSICQPAHVQETIPLYDKVPNSKPSENREKSEMLGGHLHISKVSVPAMTMYPAVGATGRTTAIIICPGGGYGILATGHEGIDEARLFNQWGITAFVLKYRLPDDSIMPDKSIGPLQDAQRAIQLVRENADKWNIDRSRIGIMGFSAGGHLAASASTHFNRPVIGNPHDISLRPDFSVLIYPVISFTDSIGHEGSRTNLIGKNPTPALIRYWSNESQVTPITPPAFLVHATDDNVVKVDNSIQYYMALVHNKVAAELHVYQRGGHGFGLNNRTTEDQWSERLRNWLILNKYIP
jgi:acetyl esterase/lipase